MILWNVIREISHISKEISNMVLNMYVQINELNIYILK